MPSYVHQTHNVGHPPCAIGLLLQQHVRSFFFIIFDKHIVFGHGSFGNCSDKSIFDDTKLPHFWMRNSLTPFVSPSYGKSQSQVRGKKNLELEFKYLELEFECIAKMCIFNDLPAI